ncbi:ABC-2 family transporter protein [Nonomuraea solani]|uniref:ABC-2 family transporter protein n=1 Tax=Nonomuraea solani TaxID=1144553 RepID=A0A1H6BZ58_9ACTN|nr:ABC transporter permease subunit [Nonomuraea solani]SEG65923.1 ABC-2 family transporter protein [Nonomuraea solani]
MTSDFRHLLRAEWTKLRTVRGWMAGLAAAALLIVGIGVLFATGSHSSCSNGPVEVPCLVPPLGPDGEAVQDRFYFVHQPLDGDGTITARVRSMTGQIRLPDATPGVRNVVSGVVPWAKAGVMIKRSTEPGSAYAAVMVTGAHGVRMQHDFTEDVAGTAGGSPRWLRLTRTGETITGEESADGERWIKVGTARLPGLPARVRVGLFAASPGDVRVTPNTLGGSAVSSRFAEVTATMDEVGVRGAATGGSWSRDDVGAEVEPDGSVHHGGGLVRNGGTFAVTGTGDIAPNTTESTIERSLVGSLIALIVVIVVAAQFVTAEYRRGLIHTTLLAAPRRGRTLAAKAVVAGGATFVFGLAATAVTVPLAGRLQGGGVFTLPVSAWTEWRVIAGVAALLAVAAVFALALGTLFRRGSTAVIAAIAGLVVPYVLAIASILPDEVSRWLLRLTPAAGFAIQQSIPEYEQVTGHYAPASGYFPLPPWAGFAVLCAYAGLALGVAAYRIERRDA